MRIDIEAIKKAMEDVGTKQTVHAHYVGIAPSTICGIFKGKSCQIRTLLKIIRPLGLTLNDVLEV